MEIKQLSLSVLDLINFHTGDGASVTAQSAQPYLEKLAFFDKAYIVNMREGM